jgi:transposase
MTARTGPVVVQSERRRNWSDDQKLLIVQESLRPGVVVAQVARRWAIGSGQLYTWRKQLLSAAAGSFIPCEIIGDGGSTEPASLPVPASTSVAETTAASPAGIIEVTVNGGRTLRISGAADADTLKLVLDALLRS